MRQSSTTKNQSNAQRWQTAAACGVVVLIIALTCLYRWYQPITHPALLEFDIFDWARQSREWLMYGHLLTPTSLWVFPIWNAIVAKITGASLFNVYLYSGAMLTTLNLALIFGISAMLWRQTLLRLMPLLLYALNTQLLPRSVNYLPETMSYTFGLALVYCYLRLFRSKKAWWIAPMLLINYFYFYLHQSGLNFLIFTAAAIAGYVLFIIPFRWRTRLLMFAGLVILGLVVLFGSVAIRQQVLYFLHGSSNVDTAFQGTAIPFSQLFTDFNASFFVLLIIGAVAVVVKMFRRDPVALKVMWGMLLLITAFYYCFLYVFPNLNIYNLVPWRFYTWFSLYAIFIVANGFTVVYHFFRKRMVLQMGFLLCFLVLNLVHTDVMPNDMYTANAATLDTMSTIRVPEKSIIITTNANYLQTRYSIVGHDYTIAQEGAAVFTATNAKSANTAALNWGTGQPVYVLISLYQLRQHPSQMAFWNNSAIPNTRVNDFTDPQYFQTIIRDDNILFVRALPQ